jgi:hypothetical protein
MGTANTGQDIKAVGSYILVRETGGKDNLRIGEIVDIGDVAATEEAALDTGSIVLYRTTDPRWFKDGKDIFSFITIDEIVATLS